MTTILAIDPGAERETSDTGWFLGKFSEDQPVSRIDSGVIHGGFEGYRNARDLKRLIDEVDVVVCEHFVKYNAAADVTPLLIEGAIRDRREGVVLQPSSGKNTAVPDRVLKTLGFYSTVGHHHDEREAARHAVWYLKKISHVPTLRAGWPR